MLFFGIALLLGPASGDLLAQDGQKAFRETDRDGNGAVDTPELTFIFIILASSTFKDYDKNGDGFLDEKEFAASKTGRQFKDADFNKDGQVDANEFIIIMVQVAPEWMKRFDKDGSGTLNRSEFDALMQEK
jgi:Ca2+-binding EF-hand superfamily protein